MVNLDSDIETIRTATVHLNSDIEIIRTAMVHLNSNYRNHKNSDGKFKL